MTIAEDTTELEAGLRDLYRSMRRDSSAVITEKGLTHGDYLYLKVIASAPGARASDIAKELGVRKGYVTALTSRMISRNLVKKVSSQKDGRSVALSLTVAGNRLFEELDRAVRSVIRVRIARLQTSESRTLLQLIRKLTQSALIFCGMSFAYFPLAAEEGPLTLDKLISTVVTTYPEIHAARDALRAAEARVATAHSAYLPSVRAQAGYFHVAPVSELTFQTQIPGTTLSIPTTFKAQPNENYDAHIGAQIRIFDFGQTRSGEDVARSQEASARDNLTLIRNKLSYLSVQLFYNILFLSRSVEVQEAQIADLEKSASETQHRVEAGASTGYDVLLIQVRIAEAKNQLLDTRNTLEQQKIQLRKLIGSPDGSNLQLQGEIAYQSVEAREQDLLRDAEGNRPEFILARDAQKTARAQLGLAENGDNPSLALSVQAGGKNGYFPNVKSVRGNYAVGVQFDVPIYSGGKTEHQIEEAKANVSASDSHLEEVKRQIHAEIFQSVSDVRTSQEKIKNAELQLTQAKDALTRAQLKYDNGVITTLELLDARTALQRSELLNLQALYNCVLAQYNMRRAAGERIWEGNK